MLAGDSGACNPKMCLFFFLPNSSFTVELFHLNLSFGKSARVLMHTLLMYVFAALFQPLLPNNQMDVEEAGIVALCLVTRQPPRVLPIGTLMKNRIKHGSNNSRGQLIRKGKE